MRRAFALCCILLAVAATAAAQADPRLARLDPGTQVVVARLIDSLRSAGVPAEPLIDKALEGQVKGAPGPRIVAAVRVWGQDLSRVRDVIGPARPEPDLVAAASVFRAGVSLDALHELAAARRDRGLLVPLTALTDLAASGMAPDSAAQVVVAVARAGGSDADFQAAQRGQGRQHAPPAGVGGGLGRGQGQVPRTVPNKKGKIPGQGNGKGPGNGNGHPPPIP